MTSTNVHKQKLAGFAFSFGDALLEIDKDCTATWALGGVQDIFAETEPSIIGKGLLDFISSADRAAVLNYLVLLRDSKRPNPIELNINGGDRDAVPVLLSGIFLEQMNDAYFLAFRKICPPKVTVEARGACGSPTRAAPSPSASSRLVKARESKMRH